MIPPMLTIDGNLYRIIRPVREYSGMDATALREFYGASHSFKKDGIMYFVDECPEVEILEETLLEQN
jgi:hypothetical protein